jgi:predicted dehydrogenase
MVGMGLMGSVHSRALIDMPMRFMEMDQQPKLVACADASAVQRDHAERVFGYQRVVSDWREVVESDDVDLVMICSPNATHIEVAKAAAAAGKHLFCEKPVGRTPNETWEIAQLAIGSDIRTMVGYVYRWAPMVQHARSLIDSGAIGEITHYRGRFLVGYASDPKTPLSWRFDREASGYGALSDLMSHVIDMAIFQAGPIAEVVSESHTFIPQRPVAMAIESSVFGATAGSTLVDVTNEDYAAALVRFENGARGHFETCRVINGPECSMAFDIHGTEGAISWNLERLNELLVHRDSDGEGTRLVMSGPQHPGHSRFWPGPGVGIGYEDIVTLQAAAMMRHMSGEDFNVPTLAAASAVAGVQDAMARSWESGRWENVGRFRGGT